MTEKKPTLEYATPSKRRMPLKLIVAAVAIAMIAEGLVWRALHPPEPDFTDAPVFSMPDDPATQPSLFTRH
jgi:hypothetical protein